MLSLLICLVLLVLKAEAMDTDIVILTANDQILTYVSTNLTVNYDGETNYIFDNGEDFYFSCKKARVEFLQLSDPLQLEYYNAEGILLFQTKPRVQGRHFFRSVLKSNNDNYYLDCIRTDGDTQREYRYRTTFSMKKRDIHSVADDHAMILSVNGHTLTAITNNIMSSNYYDDYLYRYIDGEVLTVTCRKTKNLKGSLTFNFDKATARYVISPVIRSPLEGISLNVSTTEINKKSLNFAINNSDVQKPNARLSFLSEISENGVRIRGLPRHNILYQYTNDLDKTTIEYQYSVNDALHLSCVSKGSLFVDNQRFQWEFNGETSISTASLTPTMITVSKTFTKILDATHNGKTINCVYVKKKNSRFEKFIVEIILRLKGAKIGEVISSKILSNVNISAKSLSLILGSSIGGVLIILGLTGAACWYVRIRNTRNNIETPYGDLTYQNNSPTPQYTNECEHQYDTCYSELASNKQTYYATPVNVKNNYMDPEYHYYTEIDLRLKVPTHRRDIAGATTVALHVAPAIPRQFARAVTRHKLVVPSPVYDEPSFQK